MYPQVADKKMQFDVLMHNVIVMIAITVAPVKGQTQSTPTSTPGNGLYK